MYIYVYVHSHPGESGWEWGCRGGLVLAGQPVAAAVAAAALIAACIGSAAGQCVTVVGAALAGLALAVSRNLPIRCA